MILGNLLDNALKYRCENAPPEIEFAWAAEGEALHISVRDNGIGIAPEHHEKIFEIFQRLQPQSKCPGTGIGLGLVKKAASLLGGSIRVESAPGQGSTFHIALPHALCGSSHDRKEQEPAT